MPRKRSILVVDDESSVLLTLRMILAKEGYDVITAESCAEALGMLDNGGNFDAVITDLNMEREDIGLEVARAAQQVKPKPVVMIITGFASMDNSRAALELGVDYMAHKPMETAVLLSALHRLLAKRRDSGERV